jgi:hypothetical protein
MNEPVDQPARVIYTIGHSNVPAKKIVELLKKHAVQVLVDVRSSPYSKYVPQFNREMFQSVVQSEGLGYRFAGDYLGGRPKDPTCYKNGLIPEGHADFLHLADYPAVMTKDWYQKGIQRLIAIAAEKRTAVMCSEEDPAHCHRHHLISQTLLKQGFQVLHIRSDGRTETARPLVEKKEDPPEKIDVKQLSFLAIVPEGPGEKTDRTERQRIYEPVADFKQMEIIEYMPEISLGSTRNEGGKKATTTRKKKK